MDYVRNKFIPNQLKLIREISDGLCEIISIPILAMRGIIWRALDEWQVRNGKGIAEITNLSSSEKLFFVKEIFNIAKKELKIILIDPIDQNEKLLDIIFEKAFKHYLEYVNKIKR